MIEFQEGDILKAQAEALVNTVNCEGVLGKGIALQFRKTFPENTAIYVKACKTGQLVPGRVLVVPIQHELERPLPIYIINFPTKDKWRRPSQLEWIRTGLVDLVDQVRAQGIRSIAIPPLGCGNGGLQWPAVKQLIEQAFEVLPDVQVLLFSPEGAPAPETMAHKEPPPKMQGANPLYVRLVEIYREVERAFSQLEIQKLSYFLQEAGESQTLKLNFEAGKYGPYARELSHVLDRWEGHWMFGYGDGTSGVRATMTLEPDVIKQAREFLATKATPEQLERIQRVKELIEGFDTPFGLELLGTVHWVATHVEPGTASDVAQVIHGVQEWSAQKKAKFPPQYIEIAWERLNQLKWLNSPHPSSDPRQVTTWEQRFLIDDLESVRSFVIESPYILSLLEDASRRLREFFPLCPQVLHLAPEHSSTANCDLVLAVQTSMDSPSALAILHEFEEAWWAANAYRAGGSLTVTLDFVV